jgi:hypothetical protein
MVVDDEHCEEEATKANQQQWRLPTPPTDNDLGLVRSFRKTHKKHLVYVSRLVSFDSTIRIPSPHPPIIPIPRSVDPTFQLG